MTRISGDGEMPRIVYDNQGNPIMDVDQEIDRQQKIIDEEEENRMREAAAIQILPFAVQLFTRPKINQITQKVEGINTDLAQAAMLAWQAAEALVVVGKATNKGRAFSQHEETKMKPEPKGIIQ